jgi:HlyD family secretion protein
MGSVRRVFSRMLRPVIKLAVLAVVVAVAVYVLYFKPVPVTSYTVKAATVEAEVMGTGTLAARFKTTLSSKITGKIMALGADQNDPVSKDMLLATLDDSELRQQVEVASASLEAAKAALTRVEADITRAEAVLTGARQDYKRVSALSGKQIVSADELDKSKQALDVAQAGLESSQAAKVETQRQIATAERTLKYQEALLANARILCPVDNGLVTFRYRQVGDIVVPGTAIMDVACLNEIWVSAWVDETAAASLAPGQPVRVVFRSEPEKPYAGEVARLARQTDPETREFLVDVRVKELPKNWSVGQRAEVYIKTGSKADVPSIPQRLLLWRDGKPGVFVDDGGKARYQEVGLGLKGRETVEIVRGLEIGQAVIAAADGDNSKLTDGRAIQR